MRNNNYDVDNKIIKISNYKSIDANTEEEVFKLLNTILEKNDVNA